MLRNIFLKTLRDQRMPLLWWSIGLIVIGLYAALVYPSVAKPGYLQLLETYPPAVRAMLGDLVDFAKPAGYIDAYMFNLFVPLMLLIYGVVLGSAVIAGEEERGTLDWILSNPLGRWQVLVHKALAIVVLMTALAVAAWAGIAGGAMAVGMALDNGRVAEATLSSLLMGFAFAFLALALSGIRGSRGFSAGLASAVGVGSYVLNTYAPLVDDLKPYRGLSLFYWAEASKPVINGLNVGHAAALGGLAIVLFVVALLGFERRDIAV
jgi:ABC-2 type transport system permease protein